MDPELQAALEQFYSEYMATHWGSAPSEAKVNAFAEKWAKKHNSTGMDDYDGFSPNQLHSLFADPFGETSVIQINNVDESLLADVPFFRTILLVLNYINADGKIKLTSTGAFQRKLVNEIATLEIQGFEDYKREHKKTQFNQDEIIHAQLCSSLLEISGIIHKTKTSMILTEKGKDLLSSKNRLFKEVMKQFISQIDISSFDDFSEVFSEINIMIFKLVLFAKYGNEFRDTSFYAEKYFKAFPFHKKNMEENDLLRKSVYICFERRMAISMLMLFGLVDIKRSRDSTSEQAHFSIMKKPLFDQLFYLCK